MLILTAYYNVCSKGAC